MPGILILDELQSATEGGGIKLKDPLQTQDGTPLLSPSGEVSINFDNLANNTIHMNKLNIPDDAMSGDKIHGGTISGSFLDGIKLNSSGNSITKSDGITSVLSESGGVVTLQNVTLGDSAVPSRSMNFRNKIMNGDMRIDQRYAGASVTMTSYRACILDRWLFWANGSGGSAAYTVQQSSEAPVGFTKSFVITQTAAYSPTGNEYNIFAQYIEGYNVADLGWGTSAAKAVTLSFWVRSSLTGTFGGAVSNSSQLRSYPFTYTISSANTWEYKTITVPGETTGTWLKDNNIGLEVFWQLGIGSTYLGTAGAWAEATYLGSTSATQITATNGATLYITGVQLEVGTVATPFEHRPIGTELALCQRYYEKSTELTEQFPLYKAREADRLRLGTIQYKVTKRATPGIILLGANGDGGSTPSAASIGIYAFRIFSTATSDTQSPYVNGYSAEAEL